MGKTEGPYGRLGQREKAQGRCLVQSSVMPSSAEKDGERERDGQGRECTTAALQVDKQTIESRGKR